MQRYKFFHPWLMSFFSKDLYRDVGSNWKGIAAKYMFVLQLIIWLPMIYMFYTSYDVALNKEFKPFIEQIPEMRIEKGELSIDKPVPYTIRDTETGEVIVVIDTSGQITSLDQTQAQLLITKTQVMAYKDRDKTTGKAQKIETYSLSEIDDFEMTREQVMEWAVTLKPWLMLIVYVLAVLGAFLYRVVQALLYGAIGCLFSKMMGAKLTYQQCMRLSLIAVTPAIILGTVFSLMSVSYNYQLTSYFALSMIYLFFAVKANK